MFWNTPLLAEDCPCDAPPEPALAQAQADIIFSGTCIFANTNWMSGGMKFSFAVDQTWKGGTDSLFIVHTGWEVDCGYRFEEGETYLVYVRKKFSPKTDRCMGSKPLAEAAADIAFLGTSQAPRKSAFLAPTSWVLGGLLFLALLFLAFIVLRNGAGPHRPSSRDDAP